MVLQVQHLEDILQVVVVEEHNVELILKEQVDLVVVEEVVLLLQILVG
jgi:hypothetical protein